MMIVLLPTLLGCQSRKAAAEQMCEFPDKLLSDPSTIGPYLRGPIPFVSRIRNREAIELLSTMADGKKVTRFVQPFGYDETNCNLVKSFLSMP